MAGTIAGGKAAAKTNIEKYGKDFYGKIGAKGGSVRRPETRMFYRDRKLARVAGAKGGRISRRSKAR
jgi:hypothetical protein